MFWGLQLEPTLRYSQQVPKAFRITKATLDAESTTPGNKAVVQVIIEKDGNEYPIATLKAGEVFDCTLDLRFSDGEDICFFLRGEGVVYLTGHELYSDDEDESFYPMEDSDDDSEDGFDVDDEESSGPEIEDVTGREDLLPLSAVSSDKKAVQKANGVAKPSAAGDHEEDEDDFDEDDDLDEEDEEDEIDEEFSDGDEEEEEEEEDVSVMKADKKRSFPSVNGKTPETKKRKTLEGQPKVDKTPKAEKTPKVEKVDKTPKTAKTPKGEKTPKVEVQMDETKGKKTEDSVKEIKVEDVRLGSGPVAKRGKTVHVYYTGTLMNGKKFDACTSGKPFSFKLGSGTVIQGWDQGLEGMKVGGVRRLVIPPRLAYGKRGTGPIPPNATLRFEVQLKAIH